MLVITLGDPFGVGLELMIRSWSQLVEGAHQVLNAPGSQSGSGVVIVGSLYHWRDQHTRLKEKFGPGILGGDVNHIPVYSDRGFLGFAQGQSTHQKGPIVFINIDRESDRKVGAHELTDFERGSFSKRALDFLDQDFFRKWPFSSERLAVLTGPIDKYAAEKSGFVYPGQTEFFEELWCQKAVMILAGPRLKVGLVTNHHALREVPGILSKALIVNKIRLFSQALKDLFSYQNLRIAVTGLNPHAGDSGKFGNEEKQLISPAIEEAQTLLPGVQITGPLAADTAFYGGYMGRFHGVLAMYHDQGLGPLKTVHFDEAVNISGGLPHLRISPDHGPARDLFLKAQASTVSFRQSLDIAKTYLLA